MSLDIQQEVLGYGEQAVNDPAEAVLEDRATEYGLLVALANPRKGTRTGAAVVGKISKILLIYDQMDPSFQDLADCYAQQVLGIKPQVLITSCLPVDSWQALADKLAEYNKIDHLVLMFHGSRGGMTVGVTSKGLANVSSVFTGKRPKVDKIDLLGCSIGEGANALVPFGMLFNASTITAFNYFWVSKLILIPAMTNAQTIQVALRNYDIYLLPGTPSVSSLASRKKASKIVAEWFRSDDNNEDLPPPPDNPNDIDPRPLIFKKRSQAKARRIKAVEAEKLAQEYKEYPGFTFDQVIIALT